MANTVDMEMQFTIVNTAVDRTLFAGRMSKWTLNFAGMISDMFVFLGFVLKERDSDEIFHICGWNALQPII
jgi:hypothetical protein